jgi:U6 snRNA-associated Sm-like protein LSm7
MNTDPEDPSVVTENTRTLGLVVCRGTQVCLISPVDGLEEIANPFEEEEEEEEA